VSATQIDELLPEFEARLVRLGFDLVDLRLGGSRARPRVQVRVEHPGGEPAVTVDDCTVVSHALEAWLDEGQPLGARYVLEVSSPGIERPVRWPRHWARFIDHDVHVRLPGRGRVRATIRGVDLAAATVTLALPDGAVVTVPVSAARQATLAVDWESLGLPRT
jgi:ribosome maturation factor RimP